MTDLIKGSFQKILTEIRRQADGRYLPMALPRRSKRSEKRATEIAAPEDALPRRCTGGLRRGRQEISEGEKETPGTDEKSTKLLTFSNWRSRDEC